MHQTYFAVIQAMGIPHPLRVIPNNGFYLPSLFIRYFDAEIKCFLPCFYCHNLTRNYWF